MNKYSFPFFGYEIKKKKVCFLTLKTKPDDISACQLHLSMFYVAFLFDNILNVTIYLLYDQLESFKRHLMQSLGDDNSAVS